MGEAVVKQGGLYLQLQQTFGKKWKKFWGVLYRESSCSTSRLELFEGSSPPAAEKLRRGEGSRRLVKLRDCVHVGEASGEAGCPKDTTPFLLETTHKRYLLAAEATEVAAWIRSLCQLAFPRSREEAAAGKDGQQSSWDADGEFSMEENTLYSSRDKASLQRVFEVTVRATESSERCGLRGRCILRAGEEALELRDFQTSELLCSWPYPFLRRFGRDKVTFSFEAGRRCVSGEGSFEFETGQGNEIFQAIESAISLHRGLGTEEPWRGGPGDDASRGGRSSWAQGREEPAGTKEPTWEGKLPKSKLVIPPGCSGAGDPSGTFLPSRGADCPYPEPCSPPCQGTPPALEKGGWQEPEAEYATPFDTIAKTFMARQLGSLATSPQGVPDPLYDSIGEARGQKGGEHPLPPPPPPKPDHIYDEPEALPVYDEPEEVKGEAWRLQAAPEEPPGPEYPYDPQQDDYAVPKRPILLRQGQEWLGDTEYGKVVLPFAKKRNLQ
ncbi:docking protein 2 [Heliangelus exortis]|uniref:docking protein 2 n=1 Tax=Heliangelus exortis TaxID=472823 RepID=UPI003A942B76